MAGTLLIIGLTVFLLGTVMLALDAQDRGRSSLMFALPLAGASYIHHFWSDIWPAVLLRVLGISLLLVSLAVALAQQPRALNQPGWLFSTAAPQTTLVGSKRADMNTFANSQEAVLLAIRSDDNPQLTGRLLGKPFSYTNARLIDGVLLMQQGDGFFPEREVRILLNLDAESITDQRRTLYVEPSDPYPPEVQISWYNQRSDQLDTRILRTGYQMELQITRRDESSLAGFLQVILPDPDRSYLSGEFVARTNHLRYVNGRIDLSYDHPDTLEHVARQYLESQFPEKSIRAMQFYGTRLLSSEQAGATRAQIALVNGRIEERRLRLDRSDIGWAVTPGSMESEVIQEASNGELRLVVPGRNRQRTSVPVVVPPPITLPFAELGQLVGQQVVLHQPDGRYRSGTVRNIRRERLMLESQVPGGTVEFSYAGNEISHFILASGQRVTVGVPPAEEAVELVVEPLTDAGASATESDGAEAAAPVADDSSSAQDKLQAEAESAVSQEDYAAWVGKAVVITGTDTRVRSGIVSDYSDGQLTLDVRAGASLLQYFYKPDDIANIVEVTP